MNRSPTPPTSHPTPTQPAHGHLADAADLDPNWIDPVLATVGPGTEGRTAFSWDEDVTGDAQALTELFLGSPSQEVTAGEDAAASPAGTDARDRAADAPRVDALILGHLPVLGAAWIAGYADFLCSRAATPVALLKLRGGYLTIDLFGVRRDRLPPCKTPDQAIAAARTLGARWLVCSDATEEPEFVRRSAPDGVTVLTASDDPAVLGAYQAIKGLLDPQDGQLGWPPSAELTIALAASSPEKSAAAGDKLRSAVRTFLGRAVAVEICPQRIAPASSVNLSSGPWDGSLVDLVAMVRRSEIAPAAQPPTAASTRPDRTHVRAAIREILSQSTSHGSAHTVESPSDPPSVAAINEPESRAPAPTPVPNQVPTPHAAPHSHQAPEPTPATKAPLPLASHAPAMFLSSYIQGLRPLDIACPYTPGIELALGPSGDLHLVASSTSAAGLARATAWTRAHAALLRAAVPTAVSALPPVCHIIDEDPALLRPYIESDVRAHLLVRGHASGMPYAVARPLN